jgi:hypothetical protein
LWINFCFYVLPHTIQLFVHCKWILYNFSFSFCFLKYLKFNFFSKSYLVAAIFAFLFCILFPLTLIWMYIGVSCLALHILLYQMSAFFYFSKIAFVFLQMLYIIACWASIILMYVTCIVFTLLLSRPTNKYVVHLLVWILNCTCCTVCTLNCTCCTVRTLNCTCCTVRTLKPYCVWPKLSKKRRLTL